MTRRTQAEISLAAVTVIWGATFVTVKSAIDQAAVLPLLTMRFLIATVGLLLMTAAVDRRSLRGFTRLELAGGAVLGVFLSAGYVLQTASLEKVNASTAAFLTGLTIVLVPLLGLLAGRVPGWGPTIGVAVAAAGMTLVTLKPDGAAEGASFGAGELLVIGCSAAFACHILVQGSIAPQSDVRRLTIVQLGTVPIVCGAAWAIWPDGGGGRAGPAGYDVKLWGAVTFLGLAATALAFLVQTWAQAHTTPTRTVVIFALEPVCGAAFGVWLDGDVLTALNWAGCGLIIAAILLSELSVGGEMVPTPGEEPCAPTGGPGLIAFQPIRETAGRGASATERIAADPGQAESDDEAPSVRP